MAHYDCTHCGRSYYECSCPPYRPKIYKHEKSQCQYCGLSGCVCEFDEQDKPMTKPITPYEAMETVKAKIPPEVLEVFNELIVKGMAAGGASRVSQNEAVMAIATKLMITRQEAFSRKLLDVEDVYREAGWTVDYHKPPYFDNSDPYFIFRKP